MANNVIRVGNVEIMQLSDGMLEFDPCNFFPTIPEDEWGPYESHLTDEHKVRFNLGSYLIRANGRTILVDTGLGPRPADTPGRPVGRADAGLRGQWRAAGRGGHGGHDPSPPRSRRLEPPARGERVRADLSQGAVLDERRGLGDLSSAGRAAHALSQCAHLRLAARAARARRADARRAQHHARADRGADARAYAGPREHPGHLRAASGRSSSATPRIRRCSSRSPTGSRARTWTRS